MIYDKKFLFEYLTEADGAIWKQPVDFLLNDYYLAVIKGWLMGIENDLPTKLQSFLNDYYWKKSNYRIAEDICSKIPENMIPYYFKTFNFYQLSIIFFAICYGISYEQLSFFCKKKITAENMSNILDCLITNKIHNTESYSE